MKITLLIVVSVILYIVYIGVSPKYLIQPEKPPKSVRAAGMAEAAFGVMITGALAFIDLNNTFLKAFIWLLALFWICVAVSLYKASKIGRRICLILSIVRIPTLIGIPFSLFSLYKLYFTQESRDFFDKKTKKEHAA